MVTWPRVMRSLYPNNWTLALDAMVEISSVMVFVTTIVFRLGVSLARDNKSFAYVDDEKVCQ